MKHWIACLSLSLLPVFTGCDTVNHTQLQLAPAITEENPKATITEEERETVKEVVTEIAKKHYFEDRTEISLIPQTICSFAEPDVKHPIRIIAWVTDGRIAVDMFQDPPETGETLAYRHFREEVMGELSRRFGSRVRMVHKMRQAKSQAILTPK